MNMNNVMFYNYIVWFIRINIQRISNRFLGIFLLDESNIADDSIPDGSSSSYSPNSSAFAIYHIRLNHVFWPPFHILLHTHGVKEKCYHLGYVCYHLIFVSSLKAPSMVLQKLIATLTSPTLPRIISSNSCNSLTTFVTDLGLTSNMVFFNSTDR